ncbi:transcriptional activator GLI3 [Osmerus eperlanus]|uniref:transcriptional activator GLI3 n=1 Tax=Osmerus eperlanus TaxID=29151 RepID=UPI002E0E63C3
MSAPIMDSTVSTATAALQARRGVGRPLRWMEHLKMERLKQVNGALPRLGTLSPTLPPRGSTLPAILTKGSCLGRPGVGGLPAPPPPPPLLRPELSNTELTVLSMLGRDRRDSSGSATSSAYLSSSRRSSGISPCFSSRRSSQASQSETAAGHHRRLHNLSSTDSYDPISTDASRRSSEASQCGGGGGGSGGSRGCLNLTPAQHYHLKARYAAATGGPPPTPLPNMERMNPKARMATMGEGPDGGSQTLPPLVRPRRCSDNSTNGYGGGHAAYRRRAVFYPGEGPGNGERRASDPVRTHAPDMSGVPQVQRFNSLNSIHPLPPPPASLAPAELRSFSLQNYTRSEGNLQRGLQHSPCPPSIMEHSALEALAMEGDGLLGDEDMLPDDLVQYLHSQGQGGPYGQPEDLSSGHFYGDVVLLPGGEMEQLQGMNLSFPSLQQHQQVGERERANKEGMPIQWNEVSSGSAERSPHKQVQTQAQTQAQSQRCARWVSSEQQGPASSPFGRFGNMMVQQTNQFPRDFQNHCTQGSQLQLQPQLQPQAQTQAQTQTQASCRVNGGVKIESSLSSCMELRGSVSNSTHTFGRPDFSHIMEGPLPQGYGQQAVSAPAQNHSHFQQNHSTSRQIGDNLLLSRASMESLPQAPVLHHLPQAPAPPRQPASSSYRHPTRPQHYLAPHSQVHNQASPGLGQPGQRNGGPSCSLAHQVSGLKLEAPDQGYLDQPGYSDPALCFDPVENKNSSSSSSLNSSSSSSSALEEQCLLETMAESVGCLGSEGPAALLSPGADQVTSTVDSSVPEALEEVVGLDFGSMLEEAYDQGSLVSGPMSPSIFQGLSRTSSRLTTPRASTSYHSNMPTPSLSNMALGDMSSLLTSLAEESKFLAIMQ